MSKVRDELVGGTFAEDNRRPTAPQNGQSATSNRPGAKAKTSLAPSSTAQYLTFVASAGGDTKSVEMRYEDENIWLTQKMMAELYGVTKQAISQHIEKLISDGEIDAATVKQYLTVQTEGKRQISRKLEHRITQDRLFESDFDKFIELEATQKKLEGK